LVQPFSRNVAEKEINKETKKEIAQLQYPIPISGAGKNKKIVFFKFKSRFFERICN